VPEAEGTRLKPNRVLGIILIELDKFAEGFCSILMMAAFSARFIELRVQNPLCSGPFPIGPHYGIWKEYLPFHRFQRC
jgi:hypothetical protein